MGESCAATVPVGFDGRWQSRGTERGVGDGCRQVEDGAQDPNKRVLELRAPAAVGAAFVPTRLHRMSPNVDASPSPVPVPPS